MFRAFRRSNREVWKDVRILPAQSPRTSQDSSCGRAGSRDRRLWFGAKCRVGCRSLNGRSPSCRVCHSSKSRITVLLILWFVEHVGVNVDGNSTSSTDTSERSCRLATPPCGGQRHHPRNSYSRHTWSPFLPDLFSSTLLAGPAHGARSTWISFASWLVDRSKYVVLRDARLP